MRLHMASETPPVEATRIDPKLLEILVCPLTKGPLEYDAERQELLSRQAKLAYPVGDGDLVRVDQGLAVEAEVAALLAFHSEAGLIAERVVDAVDDVEPVGAGG